MEKLKERMRRDRIKREQEEREVEEQEKEKTNRRRGKTIQIKYVNAPTIKTGRNYCILFIKAAHLKISPICK